MTPSKGLVYQFGVSPSHLLTSHNEKINTLRQGIAFPGASAMGGGGSSIKDSMIAKVKGTKPGMNQQGPPKGLFSNLMTIDESKEWNDDL
jgi:hypothetical protein